MRRRHAVKLSLIGLGVTAAVLLAVVGYRNTHREAFAHSYTAPNGNETHLHIDADITNGTRPCDPIDETATVTVGSVHEVGVCIEDYVPNSVEAFELRIRYTGDPSDNDPPLLNFAPDPQGAEEPINGGAGPDCTPGCLDDNPNANDGNDPAGFRLGAGWDCTVFGVVAPVGNATDTPSVADARIACIASITSPDLDLAANPGLLATIQFQATGTGVDTIDFGTINDSNMNTVGINVTIPTGGAANCGTYSPTDQVGCFGATILKAPMPAGTPTPTRTPTNSPPLTFSPTPTNTPTAGASPEGSGWSAGNYAALGGGVAAAAVLMTVGAWYARRRWLR